jgi:5-methylcytosine-specific restriction endonuclease McrA
MARSRFYLTPAWQRARQQALHDSGWRCLRCGASLIGMGKAAHVHHRKPLDKAPALGTEPLNLKPVCVGCHNAEHADMKRNKFGCDVNGKPIDASHPWFKTGGRV